MNTLNELKTKVVMTGKEFKELKNIIKWHKENKQHDVMNNVKITLLDNEIKATLIDDKMTVIKHIKSESSNNNEEFLLPIETIKNVKYIKNNDTYSLELVDDNQLILNDNGIEATITLHELTQYPNETSYADKNNIVNHGTLFDSDYDSLKASILTISSIESRPILRNSLIRKNYIVSTDSHRLYYSELNNINTENDIVLHEDLLKKIVSNETKRGFKATVYTNDKHTIISTDSTDYLYRNIGGNYPDIERLIPDHEEIEFTINDTQSLNEIAQRMNKIANKDKNSVMSMKLFNKNQIELETYNADRTKHMKVNLEIELLKGMSEIDFKISFSSKYLLDALKQLDNKKPLRLSFNGNIRPFIIKNTDNDTKFSLLLPVRTF